MPLFYPARRNVGRLAGDEADQSQLKPGYRYGQRQQQSQKGSQKAQEGETQTPANPKGFLSRGLEISTSRSGCLKRLQTASLRDEAAVVIAFPQSPAIKIDELPLIAALDSR
jgi:hypothetical protein